MPSSQPGIPPGLFECIDPNSNVCDGTRGIELRFEVKNELSLSHVVVTSFPEWFSNHIRKVENLTLERSTLTKWDYGKDFWLNLRFLNIKSTNIEDISNMIFLTNLERLDATGSQISVLPEIPSNDKFKQLTYLNLDATKIEKLPDWMFHLENIIEISLTDLFYLNLSISKALKNIGNLKKLETLKIGSWKNDHLHSNDSVLPDTISYCTNLNFLEIQSPIFDYDTFEQRLSAIGSLQTLILTATSLGLDREWKNLRVESTSLNCICIHSISDTFCDGSKPRFPVQVYNGSASDTNTIIRTNVVKCWVVQRDITDTGLLHNYYGDIALLADYDGDGKNVSKCFERSEPNPCDCCEIPKTETTFVNSTSCFN